MPGKQKDIRSTQKDQKKLSADDAKNLTGWEIPVAGLVAKHGPAVGQAIYRAWKGKESVFVQIRASWKKDDYHYMVISLTNIKEHGIYLEDIWVIDPKDTPLHFYPGASLPSGMGFQQPIGWVVPDKVLPRLLPAGDSSASEFMFRIKGVSGYEVITIGYELSKLNSDKSENKSLNIRLRKNGPPLFDV